MTTSRRGRMVQKSPAPVWYREWLSRAPLLIASGLVALFCAPLMPPIEDFDPDFSPMLDYRERMALIGTILFCTGLGVALVCGTVWLMVRIRTARRSRSMPPH